MDGWGDAETRTWLAMDLLAPVHELWAIEAAPGPGGEAPPAVQALTEGLLGEHRPELTEAALAGLLDLERALVVGAALETARGLVEPEVLVLVECALVDEACRLALLPLVNAAADLLVELERDAGQNEAGQVDAGEHEAARCDPDGSPAVVGPGAPGPVGDPAVAPPVPGGPVPAEAAAGARADGRVEGRVAMEVASGRGAHRRGRGGGRGPARGPVVAARAERGGRRSRAPPPGRAVVDGGLPGPRRSSRRAAVRAGRSGPDTRSRSSRGYALPDDPAAPAEATLDVRGLLRRRPPDQP